MALAMTSNREGEEEREIRNAQLHRHVKPGVSIQEVSEIKAAFDLFDIHGTGRVDAKDIQNCLLTLDLDIKSHTLYGMLSDLEKYSK